ncbi:trichohyalin-like [Brachionichthys hirsutus]|uniref:trichohyalin-like n=1 Tax=Brachionichthys hirsutus TaxID=412623 RepID=UPI003604D8A4
MTDRINTKVEKEDLLRFLHMQMQETMHTMAVAENRLRQKLKDDSVSLSQSEHAGRFNVQLNGKLLMVFLVKLQAEKDGQSWSAEKELLREKMRHVERELHEAKQETTIYPVEYLDLNSVTFCDVRSEKGLQRQVKKMQAKIKRLEQEQEEHDRAALHIRSISIQMRDAQWQALMERTQAEHEAQLQVEHTVILQLQDDLKECRHQNLQLQEENASLLQEVATYATTMVEQTLENNSTKRALKDLERRWDEQEKKSSPPPQETNLQLGKEEEQPEKDMASTSQQNDKERTSGLNEAPLLAENEEDSLKEEQEEEDSLKEEQEEEDSLKEEQKEEDSLKEEQKEEDNTNAMRTLEDLQRPIPEEKPQKKKKKWFRRTLARLPIFKKRAPK